MSFFYVKIVGTTDALPDYATMVAGTSLGSTRWEKEFACLWIKPDKEMSGDSAEAWSGALWESRRRRWMFEIEFCPFSNHLVADGDDVLHGADDLIELFGLIEKPYVWIAPPTTSGRELPPRYHESATFPLASALLPCRVECKLPGTSKTDEGNTEVTMLCRKREL